jgi:uncharacterized protein YraI
MMRSGLTLVGLLVGLLGGAWAAQGGPDCVVVDGANVRAGPGLEYAVVGVLDAGACFTVTSVSNRGGDDGWWVQVEQGRWVSAGAVALSDPLLVLEPIATPTREVWTPPPTNTPRATAAPRTTPAAGGLRWRVVVEVYAYP